MGCFSIKIKNWSIICCQHPDNQNFLSHKNTLHKCLLTFESCIHSSHLIGKGKEGKKGRLKSYSKKYTETLFGQCDSLMGMFQHYLTCLEDKDLLRTVQFKDLDWVLLEFKGLWLDQEPQAEDRTGG